MSRKAKVVMENADQGKVETTVAEPNGQKEESYLTLQDWPRTSI